MAPAVERHNIAGGVKVGTSQSPGDGAGSCEEAGHGDLRQRMRSFDRELRSQIAQRRSRKVQPPSEISRVAEPRLIHKIGSNRPRVADIQILLPPCELLNIPGNVAVWLPAGRVQRRDPVISARVEITSAEPLVRRQAVVHLNQKLIRVVGNWSCSLPAGGSYIWRRNRRNARAG